MNAIFVTPKPSNYFTSGLGLFNKTKRRKKMKERNTIQQMHIEQNRKAGAHKDRKKEKNRKACRQKVKEDNF
tara:strand:+ start:461 stop:676 length:216 start_codon:yes stop_codon:yes gene_type:complete